MGASSRGDRPRGLVGRPSARAGRGYRLLLGAIRAVGRHGLRLRLETVGVEHLPQGRSGDPIGGWIAAGVPHRTWIDPFVIATLLPTEPRLVFLGDGRAIFRSRLRRRIVRAIGGVIPIWPGGRREAVDELVEGARAALDAGAVLCLFPETGPPVPVERARPLGLGIALIALRTGRPIVPLVLGGTHELYLGRRIRLVVLPSVTAKELAGVGETEPLPAPGSHDELRLAHRAVEDLSTRLQTVVEDAHLATEAPPGTRKRLRRLTTAFR
jgi:1-acyl-sn-glycerol-3-phosphate acyltransferase